MPWRRASWGTAVLLGFGAVALALQHFAESQTAGQTESPPSAQPASLPAQGGESVRFTGQDTEDDHPAVAQGPDGRIWTAYVAYAPGRPIDMQSVRKGEFESLTPREHGDRILLRSADRTEWGPALPVTEAGLEVWRPTVSIDGQGRVVVAWPQNIDGDWEILYRIYTPASDGERDWSEVKRVTEHPGTDSYCVSVSDAEGTVWLAWQSWRDGHFEIQAVSLEDDGPRSWTDSIANTSANEWSPALAADAQGNVYLAWDTYTNGNYDVRLQRLGADSEPIIVAESARYEARPEIACDPQGRVWIAYEEGDEQWGKDYSDPNYGWEGLHESAGSGLYMGRTAEVRCLADRTLQEPAADLQKALDAKMPRSRSLPQLGIDSTGGVWLLVRHHRTEEGQGEAWVSHALRYDGRSWSEPQQVPHSSNILDNRPSLVPFKDGLLALHSSDNRTNTRNRKQSDVFATLLEDPGRTHSPELDRVGPASDPEVPPVHPNEQADIARLRNHRVHVGDKTLKLLRGEFHRHTEYTAHRDKDGTLEDSWRYALDAADLDWMGNGDHDGGYGHDYLWWQIEKISSFFHHPDRFTAAVTYERSLNYPDGHRNVMLPRRGVRPLPRGPRKPSSPETGTPDTKMLYSFLKEFGGICSVHTSATGMGTDWRDNDPQVEPVVEIYQGLRHNYEHDGAPRSGGNRSPGFVWNALQKGYRLGFQCSSDHYNTHISFGIVLAEENSRQGIIDAFKKRHCYAATDNILLVVRSGDHLMGDEFRTDRPPALEIEAAGTTPIAKVHIIRDNEYIYTAEPDQQNVQLRYTDSDARPGETHYYYVRVEQDDQNLAWGSPMWIRYQP